MEDQKETDAARKAGDDAFLAGLARKNAAISNDPEARRARARARAAARREAYRSAGMTRTKYGWE